MKIIRARAPLRLGLAGGGTDVSPYCDIYGGYVLNATIDRYAYAVIKPENSVVRFFSSDLQIEQTKPVSKPFIMDDKPGLHEAVYHRMIQDYNKGEPIPMELSTFCDAPIGSGLGSSSTLVVAMIRAFVELLNLPMDDYEIARVAFRIEREDCGFQGGYQDQYSATFGGFNFMEFYDEGKAIINPLRIKNWIICELEASLVLYFTGVSRKSATIINEQSKNVKFGTSTAVEAMHNIKNEALVMKECILKGDFEGIVDSMQKGWDSKKKSAKVVSTPRIEEIYDKACSFGALSGKVSGAGGGGFMLFFVPTEKRMDVIRALQAFGGQVGNCHFTKIGAQAWTVP